MSRYNAKYKTYFEVPKDQVNAVVSDELSHLGEYKKRCIYTIIEETNKEEHRIYVNGLFKTVENQYYTIIFIYSSRPLDKKELNDIIQYIPYVRFDKL